MNTHFISLLLGLTVLIGCRATPSAELNARVQRLTASLASAGEDPASPLALWILPREMGEVSGLALMSDG